jgi:hypothetical protein
MKKRQPLALLVCAVLAVGSLSFVAFADHDKAKEGTVVGIDKKAMTFVVRGDEGDQWTLYWSEDTKLRGDLKVEELAEGLRVRFDYEERDGKNWVTKLERMPSPQP